MGNLPDLCRYISKNHILLSEENYNEIDALVLARLVYFQFEEIYPDWNIRKVSVCDFAGDVINRPDSEDIYSADEQLFLKALALSRRYRNCIIYNFKVGDVVHTQWAAFTVKVKGTGACVIAMRGTDGTAKGWAENLELTHEIRGNSAQLASFWYLKHSDALKIYLTGHSKGFNRIADDLVAATNTQERNYLANLICRMGIPDIIAGEAGGIAEIVAGIVCGLMHSTPQERAVLFRAVTFFIKSFIILIKDLIAQPQMRRYNVDCVII